MRNFHFLFWPLLVAALIVVFIKLKDRSYLQNDTAPAGIISLELASTYTADTAIIQSWKSDTLDRTSITLCQPRPQPIQRLHKARFDVCVDFVFILFYSGLGLVIITALQSRIATTSKTNTPGAHRFTRLLIGILFLAAFLDCLENTGLLSFINDGINQTSKATGTTAFITHLAAWGKFILLGALLFLYIPLTLIFRDDGLRSLSDYIANKTFQLFRYRVLLIGLAFFTLPIWFMDQGQDLLININSSDEGVLLFMAVVTIAAFLNWWLAKLFFENKALRPVFPLKELPISAADEERQEKKASRFLGVATIIVPAVAILNALQVIRIPSWMDFFPSLLWLIGLLGIFFALIKHNVVETAYLRLQQRLGTKKSRNLAFLALFLLSFGIPTIIRLSIIEKSSNTPQSLIYLFWHLVLLAFAFLVFVSVRTCIFKEGIAGSHIGAPIIGLATALAIGFILFNLFPQAILALDCNYLSLPVLLSGIILYILVLTLLIRFSRLRKTNFVLFFIATAVIVSVSVNNDYHSVRTMDATSTSSTPALPDYFRQWLLHRKDEINASSTYPVFLVNSYGGGIKAATFTNLTITYLDSVLIAHRSKGFEHYVFSFSGASGGTIGSAVQCAWRARHLDSAGYSLDRFTDFYSHDFLTPTLGAMFGRDVWASITGQHTWRDRAAIQANIWEGFGRTSLGLDLTIPFDALWDTSTANPSRYEVPLLFSNTLNVDDGQKGICAPVTLSPADFPGAIFIRSRLDSINAHHGDRPARTISLMTGAFLSARFPFISPSGKMGPGYHFMDGGGKDNSGASTSEDVFLRLNKEIEREAKTNPGSGLDSLMKKLRFYFVSITNNPNFVRDPRKLVSNRWEPISPLVGIINSGISGNAVEADRALQMRYTANPAFDGLHSTYCSVWITGGCIEYNDGRLYEPVLPLGWQISSPSVQRLKSSFDQEGLHDFFHDGIPFILQTIKSQH
ncbi:MAG: hypothetical protein JST42_21345 [Bacteroidetes bacterium]|nr:hypothetical protein [Bacteroidota bacterium]